MFKRLNLHSRIRPEFSLERLDPRILMAADAAALAARGFVPMEWHGQSVHAKPGEWIVGLDNVSGTADEQMAAADKALGHLGLSATRHLGGDGVLLVRSDDPSLSKRVQGLIHKLPGVRYLQPNFALSLDQTPNDPDYTSGKLWGLNNPNDADIDAPEAWDLSTGGGDTVVAVIDTGVDYNHADLAGNMWVNPKEIVKNGVDDDKNGYVDDIHGANFITGSGNPMDDQGHGTHVAGTIAGVGNNGQGIVGVNWNTKVMALKFLDAAGYGSGADAIEALYYAINMKNAGVNVVATNNSYGGEPWSRAFYNAIAASADPDGNGSTDDAILFVAASGNGDWRGRAINNDNTPHYPSSYGHNGRMFDDPATSVADNLPSLENVIAVTATDSNDARASFGNYGAASVDLGAPGVNIWSAAIGGGYKYNSGTSMAAPHVAGAVALLDAYNPGATALQLKDALRGGVDLKSSLSGRTSTGGRLNLHNALLELPVTAAPSVPQNLKVAAVSSYAADITWTDVSGEIEYVLERDTNTGGKWEPVSAPLPRDTTSYRDATLLPGVTYAYRIKAVNSIGASGYSDDTSTTVVTTPVLNVPAAPSGLAAKTSGASQINLSWTDNSDDELGFTIERKSGTGAWQQIATTSANATSYENTGLVSGTTYTYRVFAYNHSTVSAASAEASATTIGASPVGTGTGLKGEYFDIDTAEAPADWWSDNSNNARDNLKASRTDSTVNFNWGTGKPVSQLLDGNTFAVRWSGLVQPRYSETYTFYIGPLDDGVGLWVNGQKLIDPTTWERDGGKSLSNTSPVTSLPIVLEAGKKYNIEVRYYDWTGDANISLQWMSPSQSQQVIPSSQLYHGPSDLQAAPDGSGQIKLTWTDNAFDETGFKIERSTNGTKWTQIATVGVNETSYVNTGLSDSTTYYYRVRAYTSTPVFDSAYTLVASARPGTLSTTGTAASLVTDLTARDELFSSTLIGSL